MHDASVVLIASQIMSQPWLGETCCTFGYVVVVCFIVCVVACKCEFGILPSNLNHILIT